MIPRTDTHTLRRELEISERRRLALKRQMVLDSLEPEDNSLWTMLDLITLLLVFFIVLYNNSLSRPRTPEQPRPAAVTQTARPETSNLPQTEVVEQVVFRPLMEMERDPRLSRLQVRLDRLMRSTRLSDYRLLLEADRIRLVIGESISFTSGGADLLAPVKPVLAELAGLLNQERGVGILVAGHTDNTPIHTEQFPSNWELSLARALAVGRHLMAAGVDPARVGIQGFGQFRPVRDNDTPFSRSENRRVEISLIVSR